MTVPKLKRRFTLKMATKLSTSKPSFFASSHLKTDGQMTARILCARSRDALAHATIRLRTTRKGILATRKGALKTRFRFSKKKDSRFGCCFLEYLCEII